MRSLPLSENPDGLAEVLGSAPVPQAAGAGRGGLINRIALFVEPVDGRISVERDEIKEEPGVAEALFKEKEEGSSEGWNPVAREVLRGEKVGLEEAFCEEKEPRKLGAFVWILLLVFLLAVAALVIAHNLGILSLGVPKALPV